MITRYTKNGLIVQEDVNGLTPLQVADLFTPEELLALLRTSDPGVAALLVRTLAAQETPDAVVVAGVAYLAATGHITTDRKIQITNTIQTIIEIVI